MQINLKHLPVTWNWRIRKAGYTISEFSVAIGLSKPSLYAWIRLSQNVNFENLLKIEKMLAEKGAGIEILNNWDDDDDDDDDDLNCCKV
jgi:hypothetical protein